MVNHDKLDTNVSTFTKIVDFQIPMLRVSKMLINHSTHY